VKSEIQKQIDRLRELISDKNFHGQARTGLERQYPMASTEMIDTAMFHIFTDGADAALEWLGDITRLAEESAEVRAIDTHHLLYHLYNWQQFEALMTCDITEIKDDLKELRKLMTSGDADAVPKELDLIIERLEANLMPPFME